MILLIVEGQSDEKVLRILLRRITAHSPALKMLVVPQGEMLERQKRVESRVRYACAENPEISKVLPCVDSECTDIEDTQRKVSQIERILRAAFPRLKLSYVVVDHSLEGWLLSDRAALGRLLGPRSQLPNYGNPEKDCRPAVLMQECFRRNSKDYMKTHHAPRLAELVDIEIISRTSDTFRTFRKAVLETD